MKKVAVLISTYNGDKYLKEQIESVLTQKCKYKIDIIVRDDGSNDNTMKILDDYQNRGLLKWYSGDNLKPAKSFLDLLSKCGKYDYYAFCDQDDVWDSEKIQKAIDILDSKDKEYAMYFSNKKIVDQNLKFLNYDRCDFVVSFETAMVRNIATGCTMVINDKLRNVIVQNHVNYIEMHDSYIYRVCLLLNGYCYFDENSYINYRQHLGNVIGYNENLVSRIKRRLKSLFKCEHSRTKTSRELLRLYETKIDSDKKEFLERMMNSNKIKNKIWLLKNKKIKTESLEKNIVFKIALILGKI